MRRGTWTALTSRTCLWMGSMTTLWTAPASMCMFSTRSVGASPFLHRLQWHLMRLSLPFSCSNSWVWENCPRVVIELEIVAQGIRKDHVEFQYNAANKALGLTGDGYF